MTDADLIALCAFEEANLEPDDGIAAVVRVILNRKADLFQSDGTIPGTIFHGNGAAFSWAGYEMRAGKYQRVASGMPALLARAEALLTKAKTYKAAWARVTRISGQVVAGSYVGPDFAKITPSVFMYLNPAISNAAWATPDKLVCVVGHHAFYRSA